MAPKEAPPKKVALSPTVKQVGVSTTKTASTTTRTGGTGTKTASTTTKSPVGKSTTAAGADKKKGVAKKGTTGSTIKKTNEVVVVPKISPEELEAEEKRKEE
eukprot:gene2057-18234_t